LPEADSADGLDFDGGGEIMKQAISDLFRS
jgi:hypothetical protein